MSATPFPARPGWNPLACLAPGFLALGLSASAEANQRWHWEDKFSLGERQNLTDWVKHAHSGMEKLFGDLPYRYDVYFHRTNHGDKPVLWAHTWKKRNSRAVNFYVNPRYSNRDLERDWTAYHELAHLMFPYLGRDGKWFAEGIASYLQYQVMYAAGELSWDQAISRYENRFSAAQNYDRFDQYAIVELEKAGWQSGANVRLYWGGAAYFLEADRRLHAEHNTRLIEVIRDYLDCCFGSRGRGARGMIRTFDRISGSEVFSEVYFDTVKQKGFPETRQSLSWLSENPPDTNELRGS
jgi:hypothetical protein